MRHGMGFFGADLHIFVFVEVVAPFGIFACRPCGRSKFSRVDVVDFLKLSGATSATSIVSFIQQVFAN